MNKKTVLGVVSQYLKDLNDAQQDISINKWKRAKAFYEIKEAVVWKKTPYNTFTEFCKQELPDYNDLTVQVWCSNYKSMSHYYTWAEIKIISGSVSYTKAVRYLPRMTKKISVKAFIKNTINLYKAGVTKSNQFKTYSINLNVDKAHAAKFEVILTAYGYQPSANGKRSGISEAFCQWLDTM